MLDEWLACVLEYQGIGAVFESDMMLRAEGKGINFLNRISGVFGGLKSR